MFLSERAISATADWFVGLLVPVLAADWETVCFESEHVKAEFAGIEILFQDEGIQYPIPGEGQEEEMISELLSQMSRIREKATESEAVVRSITDDIQVLDLAKKNLASSMTTLKRLQMLIDALAQLGDLVPESKYHEISQTLAAVKQLASTFTSYMSVPRVLQAWKQIQELQTKLCSIIDKDFNTLNTDGYFALRMKQASWIISQGGFSGSDDYCRPTNLNRRGGDITTLLSTAKPLTVKMLLDNLQIVAEFETSMSKKWATPVRFKYQDMLSATVNSNSRSPKPLTHTFGPHMGVFVDAQDRVLSDMLAPHRKNKGLKGTPRQSLDTVDAGQNDESDSSPVVVLPSSTELFHFYAQSLEHCAKLSRGSPLLDLCNVHKKWLRIFPGRIEYGFKTTVALFFMFDLAELRQTAMIILSASIGQDPPKGFILNYTLLIGDASFSHFQKILDLKGTPKAEQNQQNHLRLVDVDEGSAVELDWL
ncbi:Vps53-like protein [Lentinula guzmanii]|uniref:Vps53-like protein n=1 Tax=Lentinula guzmanii TaxID=2804957 RepID=A0AA38JFA4_9AGAR|nr:Vps53-like protein [Lentinula guzmanii]